MSCEVSGLNELTETIFAAMLLSPQPSPPRWCSTRRMLYVHRASRACKGPCSACSSGRAITRHHGYRHRAAVCYVSHLRCSWSRGLHKLPSSEGSAVAITASVAASIAIAITVASVAPAALSAHAERLTASVAASIAIAIAVASVAPAALSAHAERLTASVVASIATTTAIATALPCVSHLRCS